MTALAVTLAEAVLDAVNDADLSLEFTATRAYVPKFDQSVDGIQIKVVPASDPREPGTAGTDECATVVHVGVFKRLGDDVADELDEIDALLAFCEEIRAVLNRSRPADGVDAVCSLIVQEPIVDQKTLDESRAFLSVLACTFTGSVEVS